MPRQPEEGTKQGANADPVGSSPLWAPLPEWRAQKSGRGKGGGAEWEALVEVGSSQLQGSPHLCVPQSRPAPIRFSPHRPAPLPQLWSRSHSRPPWLSRSPPNSFPQTLLSSWSTVPATPAYLWVPLGSRGSCEGIFP